MATTLKRKSYSKTRKIKTSSKSKTQTKTRKSNLKNQSKRGGKGYTFTRRDNYHNTFLINRFRIGQYTGQGQQTAPLKTIGQKLYDYYKLNPNLTNRQFLNKYKRDFIAYDRAGQSLARR